jgi:hypothetical protein
VKIDFCEPDILDVFDEWRRAVGLSVGARAFQASDADGSHQPHATGRQSPVTSRQSLPAHLERVLTRLTAARASGSLGDPFDALIDRVSTELDAARGAAGGLRGAARQALIDRLADIDAEMLQRTRALLDDTVREALDREADEELAGFRIGMNADAFARAHAAAVDRLVRDRFRMPTIAYQQA